MAYTKKIFGNLTVGGKINLSGSDGADSSSGVLMGAGTSASPSTTSVANTKFIELRCKSTATSGDNRLMYLGYDLGGAAGGGECVRAFTSLTAANGTARGAHLSLNVSATGYVTGLGVGVDAQLYVAGIAPSGGTYFAGQSEMYFDASATIAAATAHAIHSFKANGNATALKTCKNLFAISGGADTSAGEMIQNEDASGATAANGTIRVLIDEGSGYAVRYIPYYDAANS